jgi:type I restriction enzyme M protein
MNAQSLVAKVWNFAHVLRDQGVSYQAYISQISYLLFLKMDEERVTHIGEASMLPDGARWSDIKDLSGEKLNATDVKLLDKLSKQGGIIGAIFLKAQNEIQDPAKLTEKGARSARLRLYPSGMDRVLRVERWVFSA